MARIMMKQDTESGVRFRQRLIFNKIPVTGGSQVSRYVVLLILVPSTLISLSITYSKLMYIVGRCLGTDNGRCLRQNYVIFHGYTDTPIHLYTDTPIH